MRVLRVMSVLFTPIAMVLFAAIAMAAGREWVNAGKMCAYVPQHPYIVCYIRYTNEVRLSIVVLAIILGVSVFIAGFLAYKVFINE